MGTTEHFDCGCGWGDLCFIRCVIGVMGGERVAVADDRRPAMNRRANIACLMTVWKNDEVSA